MEVYMKKLMIITITVFFLAVTVNGVAFGGMTKYLSIPGNAFVPFSDDFSYTREGSDVVPANDVSDIWFAPLYLPSGANINKSSLAAMICGTRTKSTAVDIGIWERGLGPRGGLNELVHLDIDGTDNNCVLVGNPPSKFDINQIIDNERNAYYIAVEGLTGAEFSPDGSLRLRVVRIAYYVSAGFKLTSDAP